MRKTKRRIIFVLFLLCVAVGAVFLFFYLRPDYQARFMVLWDQITSQCLIEERDYSGTDLKEIPADKILDGSAGISLQNDLLLINEEHPLAEEEVGSLSPYKDTDLLMQDSTAQAFQKLSQAVSNRCGERLLITSSYRTAEQQKQELLDSGEDLAAKPGASEHQSGLALDVCVNQYAGMGFLKSPVGEFINRESWKYGFIIRYPMLHTRHTGIDFEPWHLRYVGEPHAQVCYENNLCLEEYIDSLQTGQFYECEGYLITRQKASGNILLPAEISSWRASLDNCGNLILTGKKGE